MVGPRSHRVPWMNCPTQLNSDKFLGSPCKKNALYHNGRIWPEIKSQSEPFFMHTIYERFKFHSIEVLYVITEVIILLFQKLLTMVNMNSLYYAFRTIKDSPIN